MIEFSLAYALFVIFFSALLPGAIIALGLLNKSEFTLIERILIGFALGWILQGFLPFAEFLLIGAKFSYTLALANSLAIYVIGGLAIASVFLRKEALDIQSFKLPQLNKEPMKIIIPAALILLVALNFWVRIETLGPVYQELDPYFYIYGTQQIVTDGYNPLNDQTAWYPEAVVNHRAVPLKMYMEASWYSLYTGGKGFDNYVLSIVANIYPPIAAALAIFFVYMGLRAWYKEEYAWIAAAVASFVPIFLIKLTAGEAEVQPYAFFGLAMFLGFFMWAHKKQNILYMALAGLGYFATSLGSSSEVVAVTLFLFYTCAQAITLFLSKKSLEDFVKLSCTFAAFALFSLLLKYVYYGGVSISYTAAIVLAAAVAAALFTIQKAKLEAETQSYVLGGMVLAGVLVMAFTPIGGLVKGVASDALSATEFTAALSRTIAEQGTSGSVFEPQLGFLGRIFDHGIYIPLGYLFLVPTMLANLAFYLFSQVLNFLLGTNIAYANSTGDVSGILLAKDNSVLMSLLFFAMVASAYSLYRSIYKKEDTPVWLFVGLIFPIALVGLLKAKFVIYLGFVVAAGLAFVLGELEMLVAQVANAKESQKRTIFQAFLAIGLLIAAMQFIDSSAPAIMKAGLATRFQDNPLALQQKFSDLCDQTKLKGSEDADVCAAAKDPIGYANKSTNNQYNYKLCVYSLIADPFDQTADNSGAAYRCERVTDYWIDSMEWIRQNTENGSRITSWWDYGHWENFFGQRNAVIRNEHVSQPMIEEIAHDFISGTPQELKSDMAHYGSKYVLMDAELLLSGSSFGGKYGALNYLACVRNNQTDVTKSPGDSICEFEHLWTQVYVPAKPTQQDACTISFDKQGVIAYSSKITDSGYGLSQEFAPTYCVGQATLADGSNTTALYDMSSRSADGTLKLHKALLKYEGTTTITGRGDFGVLTLLYTKDPIWIENGTVTDGWADRTGKFYDSTLYQGFVLEQIPGFQLVYKTPDGAVKIFKVTG